MIAELNDLYIKDAGGQNPKSKLPTCWFERSRFAADASACPKRATWKIRTSNNKVAVGLEE